MLQIPKVLRQINNQSRYINRINQSAQFLSFQSSQEKFQQNLSTDFSSVEDNKKHKLLQNIKETVQVLKLIDSKILHQEACCITIETNFEAMQRNAAKIKQYVIKVQKQ
ncbi:Hypothetical_protein [Hexamita inflata]|uniref:Hypothetical_protein n=1 Tax=Hexamita inflata TaxID=28002 RepID=A0AA86TS99_9EUKA|nr:Hypothetical protein HINF_LOCUS8283 [Hexamita inflata]